MQMCTFPLSIKAKELFHSLWMECRRIVHEGDMSSVFRSEDENLEGVDIFWINYYFSEKYISGITGKGTTILDALAREIRSQSSRIRQTIGHSELMKVVYVFIEHEWNKDNDLSGREQDIESKLSENLSKIVHEEIKTEYHLIPLRLFHEEGTPFRVGPVHFTQQCDFDPSQLGLKQGEVVSITCKIEALRKHYEADWFAVVGVPNRERRLSFQVAKQATDIALIAPKLIFAAESFTSAVRLSGLSRSRICRSLSFFEGHIREEFGKEAPGLGWNRAIFDKAVRDSKPVFDSIGRRLDGYIHRSSPTVVLDQAWCNAAYWFHEALQAELDTISVVKFETSIEVLVRAESTKGSGRRMLQAFKAFFGSDADDKLEKSIIFATVKNYADALVTLRSRILHGTLSTIENETLLTRSEIRHLCRNLLINYTMDLDDYVERAERENREPQDDIESFLLWASKKRAEKATDE